MVDPVDGRPGLRLRITTADGEVIVDEHLTDTRRVLGWRGRAGPAGHPGPADAPGSTTTGPLQLGVIGIGTWTVTAGDVRASSWSRR